MECRHPRVSSELCLRCYWKPFVKSADESFPLGCSAVIKFGAVADDFRDVFESCDSAVVDVDLPLAYRDFADVFLP